MSGRYTVTHISNYYRDTSFRYTRGFNPGKKNVTTVEQIDCSVEIEESESEGLGKESTLAPRTHQNPMGLTWISILVIVDF